jgi:hypothetical protein
LERLFGETEILMRQQANPSADFHKHPRLERALVGLSSEGISAAYRDGVQQFQVQPESQVVTKQKHFC